MCSKIVFGLLCALLSSMAYASCVVANPGTANEYTYCTGAVLAFSAVSKPGVYGVTLQGDLSGSGCVAPLYNSWNVSKSNPNYQEWLAMILLSKATGQNLTITSLDHSPATCTIWGIQLN